MPTVDTRCAFLDVVERLKERATDGTRSTLYLSHELDTRERSGMLYLGVLSLQTECDRPFNALGVEGTAGRGYSRITDYNRLAVAGQLVGDVVAEGYKNNLARNGSVFHTLCGIALQRGQVSRNVYPDIRAMFKTKSSSEIAVRGINKRFNDGSHMVDFWPITQTDAVPLGARIELLTSPDDEGFRTRYTYRLRGNTDEELHQVRVKSPKVRRQVHQLLALPPFAPRVIIGNSDSGISSQPTEASLLGFATGMQAAFKSGIILPEPPSRGLWLKKL